MYADKITRSMKAALDETNLRRSRQQAYNEEHGIEPRSVLKAVHDLTEDIAKEELAIAEEQAGYTTVRDLPKAELNKLIKELEKQMKQAAQSLEFEKAAVLRDQIMELRQVQVLKDAGADGDIPEWERIRRLDEMGLSLN
jgi:excinuclease ABC subunit B